jgi:hypothetical protein
MKEHCSMKDLEDPKIESKINSFVEKGQFLGLQDLSWNNAPSLEILGLFLWANKIKGIFI